MTTPKDTWISVKDAMPTKDTTCKDCYMLVCDGFGVPIYGAYNLISNRFIDIEYEADIYKPTHWMLLSKPKNK